jgi:hypothetical protein
VILRLAKNINHLPHSLKEPGAIMTPMVLNGPEAIRQLMTPRDSPHSLFPRPSGGEAGSGGDAPSKRIDLIEAAPMYGRRPKRKREWEARGMSKST